MYLNCRDLAMRLARIDAEAENPKAGRVLGSAVKKKWLGLKYGPVSQFRLVQAGIRNSIPE